MESLNHKQNRTEVFYPSCFTNSEPAETLSGTQPLTSSSPTAGHLWPSFWPQPPALPTHLHHFCTDSRSFWSRRFMDAAMRSYQPCRVSTALLSSFHCSSLPAHPCQGFHLPTLHSSLPTLCSLGKVSSLFRSNCLLIFACTPGAEHLWGERANLLMPAFPLKSGFPITHGDSACSRVLHLPGCSALQNDFLLVSFLAPIFAPLLPSVTLSATDLIHHWKLIKPAREEHFLFPAPKPTMPLAPLPTDSTFSLFHSE